MNFFFLIFSLVILKPNYCSCPPPLPLDDTQYNEYNLIAKGKISKTTVEDFKNTIYLTIETYYKGGENKPIIKITTPSHEGECGIFPKVGEKWLMFAYANGSYYRTNLCTRTKNMNQKAWDYNKTEIEADIKYLETKVIAGNR